MNWLKSTMSLEQYTQLQNKFSTRLITLPRPQKAFMYVKDNNLNFQNQTGFVYEIFFTPDCNIHMKDFIDEYHFIFCEKPERNSVIGLCTIDDFEDSIWN